MININTNAIYTIISDGETSWFCSHIAGGYTYPFYLYNQIQRIVEVINNSSPMGKVAAAEVAPLMKSDQYFPEDNLGDRILISLSEKEVKTAFEEFAQTGNYPFVITLDFDSHTIGYKFNKNCSEINIPDVKVNYYDSEIAKQLTFIHRPKVKCFNDPGQESAVKDTLVKIALKNNSFPITVSLSLNGFDTTAKLPIDEKQSAVLKKLFCTDDLDNCSVTNISCSGILPEQIESCSGASLSVLNEIAKWAVANNDMYASQVLDAAIEAYKVTDLNAVLKIIDHIYDFEFVEGQDYDAYGYDALYISDRDDIDIFYDVKDFIDFKAYGEYRAEADGAIKTENGFIYCSTDYANDLHKAEEVQPGISM